MQPNVAKILISTTQINIPLCRENDKLCNAQMKFTLLRGVRTHPVACASCCPVQPRRTQPCQRETSQHPSESDGLTRTLTLWRLHLEDTSAHPPPTPAFPLPCLDSSPPVSVCLVSRSSPSLPPRTHTEPAVRVGWLTGTAGQRTSQASFQKCDRTAAGPPTAGEDMRVGLPHQRMGLICWTFRLYLDWFKPEVLEYKAQRATNNFSSMSQMSVYSGCSGHITQLRSDNSLTGKKWTKAQLK